MLAPRLLALPVLVLGLAAGCGGADPSTTPEPAGTPHVTISTPTPTPTPAVSPTPTPAPRPTATPTQGDQSGQGGNGDADETAGPATAGGGICGRLSAEEVGRVLGGTVRGKALGGVPGCTFTQADARAYAATLTPAKSMAAARDEATSAVEGTPRSVPGVGAEAFVVTGTMFGGEDVQAAGAVRVGTQVVSVALSQEKGLPAAQVRDRLVALLRLVVSQSG